MENPHLNILVQLAKVDGITDESELELLKEIGKSENLSEEEIEQVLASSEDGDSIPSLQALNEDERAELMCNIVLMMKADGKVLKEEMKFCLKVVRKLGYRDIALFELVSAAYSDPPFQKDKSEIKRKLQEYLLEL